MPKGRVVSLSIAFAALLAATTPQFHVGAVSDYANQSSEKVTVAAQAYDSRELQETAFGKKLDFLRYGVLPVLVVIENKRQSTLDLRQLEVNLVASDGRHASAVSADDLLSLGTPHGSRAGGAKQVPLPIPLPKQKNPFNSPVIVERSFSAKMLPPGDSASGFFYFEAKPEPGDKLYLNGLHDTPSGHDLLYFEFPLAKGAE